MEIVETEHQVAQFLKKGVNMITREGRLISMMIFTMSIFPVKSCLIKCSPKKAKTLLRYFHLQETS